MAAILHLEGFHDNGFKDYYSDWSTGTLETTDIPYTGGGAVTAPLGTSLNLPLTATSFSEEHYHLFMRFKIDAYQNDSSTYETFWRRWTKTGGNQGEYLDIRVNPNGEWGFFRYNNVQESSWTMPDGAWNTLEISWQFTASTTVNLRIEANGVAVHTSNPGGQRWDTNNAHYITPLTNIPTTYWRFSDIVVEDQYTTTFWKNLRTTRLLPDADGALTDWTGAYTDIDDDDPQTSTATSITSNTPGHQSTFSHDAMPGTANTIVGVAHDVWMDGTGTADSLYRTSGGTLYTATDAFTIPASPAGLRHIYDQSPDTASAWTRSEIDNGQFGIELN